MTFDTCVISFTFLIHNDLKKISGKCFGYVFFGFVGVLLKISFKFQLFSYFQTFGSETDNQK